METKYHIIKDEEDINFENTTKIINNIFDNTYKIIRYRIEKDKNSKFTKVFKKYFDAKIIFRKIIGEEEFNRYKDITKVKRYREIQVMLNSLLYSLISLYIINEFDNGDELEYGFDHLFLEETELSNTNKIIRYSNISRELLIEKLYIIQFLGRIFKKIIENEFKIVWENK